jgi:[CysO sulfur-carrier protein]-S-L-cysteine hydrolase
MWGEAVPPALLRAVCEHAAAAYPDECCGLVLGPRGGPLDEVRRCANASGGDCRRAFELAPDDLLELAVSLDGPRPARVVYHSHPDAPAGFSAEDERLALLGGAAPAWPFLHLVVEVRAGRTRAATLHGWDPQARCFHQVARYETGGTAAPAV